MGAGRYFDSALSTRGGRANFITSSDIISGDSLAKEILDEMEKEGIKYSKEKIVFAAKLENGNKIFLEQAAVNHIVLNHSKQFDKTFGASTFETIASILSETISKGVLIESYFHVSNGMEGYRNIYYYEGKYMITYAIASNGYIETAFPIKYKGGNL